MLWLVLFNRGVSDDALVGHRVSYARQYQYHTNDEYTYLK